MKKDNLFQRQRAQQAESGILADSENSVVCPLCWKHVNYDELSVEHVIPYEVGGRREVLTCRPCNNGLGSRIDSHLAGYMKDVAAGKGARRAPCEATIEGHRLTVNASFGNQVRIAN